MRCADATGSVNDDVLSITPNTTRSPPETNGSSGSLYVEKNESGQPGDEKSVGYPFGDVIASSSFISASESL